MTDRLNSHILVQALIRKTQSEGGFATVLRSGDRISGAILVQTVERGQEPRVYERISDFSGGYALMPIATQYSGDPEGLAQYIERRCKSDPDLWLVELDVANAERLAAALLTEG
tara:strand:- start:58137 stop:58478 length:342 start_codon:yes stop_codon:yes gene_type:complete